MAQGFSGPSRRATARTMGVPAAHRVGMKNGQPSRQGPSAALEALTRRIEDGDSVLPYIGKGSGGIVAQDLQRCFDHEGLKKRRQRGIALFLAGRARPRAFPKGGDLSPLGIRQGEAGS
jgi:hypothetical protein